MSRRLNINGFSMARMRRLLGSRDAEAVQRICATLADHPGWGADHIGPIIERAIMVGVPFPDLTVEGSAHAVAAGMLAQDGQEWLMTNSSHHAGTMEEVLWPICRKRGSPEARTFIRGLVEGVPLFGASVESEEGSPYAMISLEKLRFFRPALADLRVLLEYQVETKKNASDQLIQAAEFAGEFLDLLDQVMDAGLDLYYSTD